MLSMADLLVSQDSIFSSLSTFCAVCSRKLKLSATEIYLSVIDIPRRRGVSLRCASNEPAGLGKAINLKQKEKSKCPERLTPF
jgi:hypothetical protein